MPRLEFTINVKPFGAAAQKDAAKLTGELRSQDKELGKVNKSTHALVKSMSVVATAANASFSGITSVVNGLGGAVDNVNRKILHSFKHTFEKVKDHIKESFKVTTGEFMHDALEKVFEVPKKIFEAGRNRILARERLGRQFGENADFYERISHAAGAKAGLEVTGLFPIAEAVDDVQAGSIYHGRKLNEKQARGIRESLFNKGASLFSRIATVTHTTPEESEQLQYLLANAGTGPEGMRGLVAALHLNKAFSAKILKANEKGGVADLITPDLAKELGIKRGQKIGQGDLIDILLRKSGITDKAAEDERKKLGFQLKSIGATFETALGDIGSRALGKILGGFKEGTTYAEKFQKALESPEGQKTIEKIGDTVGNIVTGIADMAKRVPEILASISKHKTTLELLGGAYVGLSLIGKGKGIVDKVKDVATGGVTHVWVDNPGFGGSGGGGSGVSGGGGSKLEKAGAVLGALTAGYGFGTFLDESLGISDYLTGTGRFNNVKEVDDADFAADEKRRKYRKQAKSLSGQLPADVRGRWNSLADQAYSVGGNESVQRAALQQLATLVAQYHVQPNVNVYVGGKQMVATIETEQVRRIKNETHNGAAR